MASPSDQAENVENDEISLEPQNGVTPDTTRLQSSSCGDHEDESAILLLESDHPKMVQFQAAVKVRLLKMKEEYEMTKQEIEKALKVKMREKDNLGINLYTVQQELAQQQMVLETQQDKYVSLNNIRMKQEVELEAEKNKHAKLTTEYHNYKIEAALLQNEIEKLGLQRFHMRKTQGDIDGDIKLLKGVTDKTESDVLSAQMEKKKQDLFVDRLVENVQKLQDEIDMHNAQYKLQVLETRNATNLLHEAELQLASINLEKSQLQQYWQNSLIGMKRRDEAYTSTLTALRHLEEDDMRLDAEIIGYRKSILSEQEQSQKLTNIFNKNKKDSEIAKEMLKQCRQKHDNLKMQYSTYSHLLQETEKTLNRASMEKSSLLKTVEGMKTMVHKERQKQKHLETETMEKLQSQLMFEKSLQFTDKLTNQTKEISQQLTFDRIILENIISKIIMEFTSTKAKKAYTERIMQQIDEEIEQRNGVVAHNEEKIFKRAALIARKQMTIDSCNRKLEVLIHKAGGIELGPLESTINSLKKSIREREQEYSQQQQMWLQKQDRLVQLIKERDMQLEVMDTAKKEMTVHSQKKMRIENKICKEESERSALEQTLTNCRNDIIKLNELTHKEKKLAKNCEQNNILVENHFILSLQESKMDLINLEEKLENLNNEKERLLQTLVDTDQEIMLWERKIQLLRETRAAVQTDIEEGEISVMRSEIHRMQIRHKRLIQQQDEMIRETENYLNRRDNIAGKGRARLHKKVLTKGNISNKLRDLKRDIKQVTQDAKNFSVEIKNLQTKQNMCGQRLDTFQQICLTRKSKVDNVEKNVKDKLNIKYKGMLFLLEEQQRGKYLQLVKNGTYKFFCRKNLSRFREFKNQLNKTEALKSIIDQLKQEYPSLQDILEKVSLALNDLSEKYAAFSVPEEELENLPEEA